MESRFDTPLDSRTDDSTASFGVISTTAMTLLSGDTLDPDRTAMSFGYEASSDTVLVKYRINGGSNTDRRIGTLNLSTGDITPTCANYQLPITQMDIDATGETLVWHGRSWW